MDPVTFFRRSTVLVVAGKGGVGKSTVTASIAVAAASVGLRVLAIELEGRGELPRALGLDGLLTWDQREAVGDPSAGSIAARRIRPDDALVEWLEAHSFGPVIRRLRSSGVLEVVAFAIPGIREVLVLGKLKALERSGEFDLLVVDAPATGHALTLLTSPSGLQGVARGGPIRRNAEEVADMLGDPARCRVVLVTLPRELAVDETIEAAFEVEDRAGVKLSEVIVNQYEAPDATLDRRLTEDEAAPLDPLVAAAVEASRRFESARQHAAADEVSRLALALPLPQLMLPHLDVDRLGLDATRTLADALLAQIEGVDAT